MGDIARDLAAHREFFRVGDAVDPDRPCAEHPAYRNGYDAGRRSGRDDNVRLVLPDDPEDLRCCLEVLQGRIAIAVTDKIGAADAIALGKARQRVGIDNVVFSERLPQEHQLLPVAA